MIMKQHILTVSNNKCSLNKPIIIFNGDDKICLEIEIRTPELFTLSFTNQYDMENLFYSFESFLRLENGRVIRLLGSQAKGNIARIFLNKELLATLDEPGKAEMQIILKSADNARMTLPIFTITIGEPLFIENETPVENHAGRLGFDFVEKVTAISPSNGVLSVHPKASFQQAKISGNVQIQIPHAPVCKDIVRLYLEVTGTPKITYSENIYFGAFPKDFSTGKYEIEFFHEGDGIYTGIIRRFEM